MFVLSQKNGNKSMVFWAGWLAGWLGWMGWLSWQSPGLAWLVDWKTLFFCVCATVHIFIVFSFRHCVFFCATVQRF